MRILSLSYVIIFIYLTLKKVTVNGQAVYSTIMAPDFKFTCGKRDPISITFGFGSPGNLSPSFRSREAISPRLSKSIRHLFDLRKLKSIIHDINVVGGFESYENSWPWMGLLGRKQGSLNDFFCSGVLINEGFLITAAHCVLDLAPFFIRLGEHDLGDGKFGVEDISVEDIYFHPNYSLGTGYYDVALIKLSQNVTFSDKIKPVCLPWEDKANENLINRRVIVTGWGAIRFGSGKPSQYLKEAQLTVLSPSVCEKSYSTLPTYSNFFPDGMKQENIICAGDKNGRTDACQGDSGGPMVKENSNGSYTMVGVISRGYGCGHKDFPGLYAPLGNPTTLEWIKKIAF